MTRVMATSMLYQERIHFKILNSSKITLFITKVMSMRIEYLKIQLSKIKFKIHKTYSYTSKL